MKTPEDVLESYWSSIDTMVPPMHKNLIINAMLEYASHAVNEQREIMRKHLNLRNVPRPKYINEIEENN